MVFSLEIKDLFYILAVFIGFVTGTVLLIFGIRKKKENILIGTSYLCLSYGVLVAFLIYSGYHILFPALYRTGNIPALLFAPLAYLYVRSVVENKDLKPIDFLHFLPGLIFFIDFFPIFFFTSLAEKENLINSEISNPTVFVYFNQSRFFPQNFYTIFRTILILGYWVASARVILKFGKAFQSKKEKFGKEWVLWMKTYLGSNLLLFVPFFIFSRFTTSEVGYDLIHFSGAIVLFINSLMVMFFPKVLYGLDEPEISYPKIDPQKAVSKDENSPLTLEKAAEIQNKLHQAIETEKIYLQNGLTISELSKHTEIPTYLLTIYLNQNLGTTFSEFINQKRVEECCRLIENGTYKHLTLEGLGISCGFNNRNSFISSFKKYKGKTPSEFTKSNGKALSSNE